MNKVTFKSKTPKVVPLIGDIYTDEDKEYLYILSSIFIENKEQFVAIALNDGQRWTDPDAINEAVDGLTFVGRGMNISVS